MELQARIPRGSGRSSGRGLSCVGNVSLCLNISTCNREDANEMNKHNKLGWLTSVKLDE